MAGSTRFHTAEMVRGLIDEARSSPRYETVYGELLVTPAPTPQHQRVVGRLFRALAAYLEREPVGEAMLSPADVSWGRDDVLVQPDVFVVPTAYAGAQSWRTIRALLLAVEVVSPGSARADRFTKRRLYQVQGVPLYWLIDADRGSAEVWTPETDRPRTEHDTLVWRPTGATTGFTAALAELLRPG